jgi:hypothetical protein
MTCREAFLRAGKVEEDNARILTHGNRHLISERCDRSCSRFEVSEELFASEGLEGFWRQLFEWVFTYVGREAALQFVSDRTVYQLGVYPGVVSHLEAMSTEAQAEQIDPDGPEFLEVPLVMLSVR